MNAIEQGRRGGGRVRGHCDWWVRVCDDDEDQRGVLVREAGREGGNESKGHAPSGFIPRLTSPYAPLVVLYSGKSANRSNGIQVRVTACPRSVHFGTARLPFLDIRMSRGKAGFPH